MQLLIELAKQVVGISKEAGKKPFLGKNVLPTPFSRTLHPAGTRVITLAEKLENVLKTSPTGKKPKLFDIIAKARDIGEDAAVQLNSPILSKTTRKVIQSQVAEAESNLMKILKSFRK